MNASQNSLALWFKEVVQPQLDILSSFAEKPEKLPEFDAKAFFKLLLADLELLGLDNMVVENCTERIIDGLQTLKRPDLNWQEVDLKEVAMIALMKNRFDRSLFKTYWSDYLPLIKKHKDLKDTSIVNAYKVQMHITALVNYISTASFAEPLQEAA